MYLILLDCLLLVYGLDVDLMWVLLVCYVELVIVNFVCLCWDEILCDYSFEYGLMVVGDVLVVLVFVDVVV